MKYIALLLLLLSFYNGFGQDGLLPLDKDKNVYYADLGKADKSRATIYKNAQNWISATFGNYENAVKQDDPQSGKLAIISYVPVSGSSYEYVRFQLAIDCEDNRYQARIDRLDGISRLHSPERLGIKNNDVVTAKEQAVKTENNRKNRTEAEEALKTAKADNDAVNTAMFKLLASLKQALTAGEQ
ncbi:DUF4468 domain-containing protein [Dyadobacter sediminis]|uniref:DUF4468 domain-containing protein n=1 Tax=Dyadobacter sediminis TaxID=1493691 RepID=A0A5R9KFL8_9BACT|nr:DUF4468 domain-containing protein [Dyadobacter sediminis]TLU94841.1 DUF4468 domain-containing protein [Dyadobacter sediminis]GGB87512.1 hypothetical protein GCM10011325_13860 [Dyadobacter sediminis]